MLHALEGPMADPFKLQKVALPQEHDLARGNVTLHQHIINGTHPEDKPKSWDYLSSLTGKDAASPSGD